MYPAFQLVRPKAPSCLADESSSRSLNGLPKRSGGVRYRFAGTVWSVQDRPLLWSPREPPSFPPRRIQFPLRSEAPFRRRISAAKSPNAHGVALPASCVRSFHPIGSGTPLPLECLGLGIVPSASWMRQVDSSRGSPARYYHKVQETPC